MAFCCTGRWRGWGATRMCFSATASFTAGALLAGVGAVTLRSARRQAEIPYASIPLLFGVQQVIEGALWLTVTNDQAHLNTMLTHVYSVFSHILWPIFIPLAVLLLENVPWRRKVIGAIAAGGAFVAAYFTYFFMTDPTVSKVEGGHITYVSPHFFIGPVLTLYILGTCASSLLSSHREVRWFGMATTGSLIAAYAFYAYWFISVWCFFAAAISITVMLYFRAAKESSQVAIEGC